MGELSAASPGVLPPFLQEVRVAVGLPHDAVQGWLLDLDALRQGRQLHEAE
ncbi:MAG: hypothetical protein OXM56_06870 [Gammaproteobacteria bacterium]|nr:hypothetical protein [Gammaproteobacteria bacterium]